MIMPQIHLPWLAQSQTHVPCSPDPARSTERPARKHLLQQPSNRQLTALERALAAGTSTWILQQAPATVWSIPCTVPAAIFTLLRTADTPTCARRPVPFFLSRERTARVCTLTLNRRRLGSGDRRPGTNRGGERATPWLFLECLPQPERSSARRAPRALLHEARLAAEPAPIEAAHRAGRSGALLQYRR